LKLPKIQHFGIKILNNYFKFWPAAPAVPDSLINSIGTILGWLSSDGIDNI
jgi:hypothetical protein